MKILKHETYVTDIENKIMTRDDVILFEINNGGDKYEIYEVCKKIINASDIPSQNYEATMTNIANKLGI